MTLKQAFTIWAYSPGNTVLAAKSREAVQRVLMKKRDITEVMPFGALDYYRKDAIRDTKRECIAALEKVMAQYETSKANINTIVSGFRKEIKED